MPFQSPFVTSSCAPNCPPTDLSANTVTAFKVDACDLRAGTINGVTATQRTTTTLALDQILDLHNTPVTLIPNQGAGKMIVPGLIEVYLPEGAEFTNIGSGDWLQFNYGSAIPPQGDYKRTVTNLSVHQGFFDSPDPGTRRMLSHGRGGAINTFGIYGTSSSDTPVNQPLTVCFADAGTGVTGGRGGLQIRVYYTVVDVLGPF